MIFLPYTKPNLQNQGSIGYWLKWALFLKNCTKHFTTPYSIPFLSVLHQNKALHNFHKRGWRPTAEHVKGLDIEIREKIYRKVTLQGC